jgi:hypothetical protein
MRKSLFLTATLFAITVNESFEAKFDDQKSIYVLPEGFPED